MLVNLNLKLHIMELRYLNFKKLIKVLSEEQQSLKNNTLVLI